MIDANQLIVTIYGCILLGIRWVVTYFVFLFAWKYLGIHTKYGFFHTKEPEFHFTTSIKNWKVPFLWGVGLYLTSSACGLNLHSMHLGEIRPGFAKPYIANPDYVFLHSPNVYTDLLYAVAGFYFMDFTDWCAHWLNHKGFLYKKFPVAHFVHHNMVFVNPMTVASSPAVHLAQLSGFFIYVLFLSQNLNQSIFWLHCVKMFTNFNSHLGCDPLPWLTRLNHRVGGWIPWIPLHHQYHHIPFVRKGNYGNMTVVWDYVFGTLVPECTYHIENGKPTEKVLQKMQDENTINRYLQGKTRFNLD